MASSPGAKALVVLVSTLLSLAVAEMALRLAGEPRPPLVGWRWDRSPYKSEEFRNDRQVNALQWRGRPINYQSGDFVVALVGDSYVEAGTQPVKDMPEIILEEQLKAATGRNDIRTVSVASAGWGQDQQLVALREYFASHRADLVVVWFTPVNDYWENAFTDRSVDMTAGPLKPTFRLEPDGRLAPVPMPDGDFALVRVFRDAMARLRGVTPEKLQLETWMRGMPKSELAPAEPASCPAREVAQNDLIKVRREGRGEVTVVTNEAVGEARTHYAPFLVPMTPRQDYQIAVTHRLLTEIGNLAAGKGAGFRIFYPGGSDLDHALRLVRCVRATAENRLYAYRGDDLLRFLKASPLRERLFAADISAVSPSTLQDYDWHLNRAANEAALRQLAEHLAAAGLVPAANRSQDNPKR